MPAAREAASDGQQKRGLQAARGRDEEGRREVAPATAEGGGLAAADAHGEVGHSEQSLIRCPRSFRGRLPPAEKQRLQVL